MQLKSVLSVDVFYKNLFADKYVFVSSPSLIFVFLSGTLSSSADVNVPIVISTPPLFGAATTDVVNEADDASK